MIGWNDKRTALLLKLWDEGKSAYQIAKILGGVTRNAVIGKAHRLRHRKDNKRVPIDKPSIPKTHPVSRPAPIPRISREHRKRLGEAAARAAALAEEVEAVAPENRVTLLALTDCSCHWPIGHPASETFRFCGAAIQKGQRYCDTHAARAFVPATQKQIDSVIRANSVPIRRKWRHV